MTAVKPRSEEPRAVLALLDLGMASSDEGLVEPEEGSQGESVEEDVCDDLSGFVPSSNREGPSEAV